MEIRIMRAVSVLVDNDKFVVHDDIHPYHRVFINIINLNKFDISMSTLHNSIHCPTSRGINCTPHLPEIPWCQPHPWHLQLLILLEQSLFFCLELLKLLPQRWKFDPWRSKWHHITRARSQHPSFWENQLYPSCVLSTLAPPWWRAMIPWVKASKLQKRKGNCCSLKLAASSWHIFTVSITTKEVTKLITQPENMSGIFWKLASPSLQKAAMESCLRLCYFTSCIANHSLAGNTCFLDWWTGKMMYLYDAYELIDMYCKSWSWTHEKGLKQTLSGNKYVCVTCGLSHVDPYTCAHFDQASHAR